jgi:hypothetical protein
MPFVDRLLAFENKRPESVEFFTRLVANRDAGKQARIAASSTLEDPRIFRFDKSDELNERIFQTCRQMLRDGEPAIRGAGAALLHNVSVRAHVADRPAYVQRAKAAIGEALAAENDAATRDALDLYLELISK